MKVITNLFKVSLPLAIITLLCSSPAALFAQPQGDKEEKREALKEKIVKDLGLSEEQQAKFSEHSRNTAAKHKEARQALKTSEKQLREELAKYEADQAKIQTLATAVKRSQAEMVDSRIADIATLKSILTKEQFEKLQQKAKARKEGFMKHRQQMEAEENK